MVLCLMSKPQNDSQEMNLTCFQMQNLHGIIIARTKNVEMVENEKIPLSLQSSPNFYKEEAN